MSKAQPEPTIDTDLKTLETGLEQLTQRLGQLQKQLAQTESDIGLYTRLIGYVRLAEEGKK